MRRMVVNMTVVLSQQLDEIRVFSCQLYSSGLRLCLPSLHHRPFHRVTNYGDYESDEENKK